MIKIFLEIFKRVKNSIANEKVFHLLIITILFTFLYLCLDDTHFSGINKLQQIMRDELIKKEIKWQTTTINQQKQEGKSREKFGPSAFACQEILFCRRQRSSSSSSSSSRIVAEQQERKCRSAA